MTSHFAVATAEQVVVVVDAVLAKRCCDAGFVEEFSELSPSQATNALGLAEHLGLLAESNGQYACASPLCRMLSTASESQRAMALRVVLDSYEPFLFFQQRLMAGDEPLAAAHKATTMHSLGLGKREVRDVLVSLGTYSGALVQQGGGRYQVGGQPSEHDLADLTAACEDEAAAAALVVNRIGIDRVEKLSRQDVVAPLTTALLKARSGDARAAIVNAGNAVESFLVGVGSQENVSLSGAMGINSKLDKLQSGGAISKKHLNFGKYLGHLRNAADHGIDPDVSASWEMSEDMGVEYTFSSCSFIRSTLQFLSGDHVL